MGRARGRRVVSAGALALAIGGIPISGASAAAGPDECHAGQGDPVAGLADGLCHLLGDVTSAVDGLTGAALAPLAQQAVPALAEEAANAAASSRQPPPLKVAGDETDEEAGEHETPVERDAAAPMPLEDWEAPPVQTAGDLLADALEDMCLPGLGVPGCEAAEPGDETGQPAPAPPDEARGEEHLTGVEAGMEAEVEVVALPARTPPSPPLPRPPYRLADTAVPTGPEPSGPGAVDVDTPRLDLLWPYVEQLPERLRVAPGNVRQKRPSDDSLGTALTAALLLSAILAARFGHTRRSRAADGSIPFEPLHPRGGRHRLA
ncbi:hypothetical protein [Microtetraspora sp. NBRC 13810]|uniref:hypothetical protein n=1 Tax=Microtetraspora sp. NBRC 13810 TaxID=3030990 RepID=UPI002555C639|nr:hypothetical protein [Microtetraspora sp. NBRC 13810]